jgi:hypothetical protein
MGTSVIDGVKFVTVERFIKMDDGVRDGGYAIRPR